MPSASARSVTCIRILVCSEWFRKATSSSAMPPTNSDMQCANSSWCSKAMAIGPDTLTPTNSANVNGTVGGLGGGGEGGGGGASGGGEGRETTRVVASMMGVAHWMADVLAASRKSRELRRSEICCWTRSKMPWLKSLTLMAISSTVLLVAFARSPTSTHPLVSSADCN